MKSKSIFRSIPIIAIVIIFIIKMIFPEFAKNDPVYLYLVLFLVAAILISAMIYWYHNKPTRQNQILLAIGLIGMLIIFCFQFF